MDYRFKCDCGREITVSQTAAGTLVDCACGRSVRVPSLGQLRALAGVATVSPDFEVAQLLRAGLLPEGDGCIACGHTPVEKLRCWIVCERARVEDPTHLPWWSVLLFILFLPFGIFLLWRPSQRRKYGQDVVFPVPFPLCSACRPMVSSPEAIKAVLRLTPVYARLLDKYPQAEVSLLHEQ